MPQLDIITFSLQLGLIILLQWTLIKILMSIILPSYLFVQNTKKVLFIFLNSFTFMFKKFLIKSSLYFISYSSQWVLSNFFFVPMFEKRIKKMSNLYRYKIYLNVIFRNIFSTITNLINKSINYYNLKFKFSTNYLLIDSLIPYYYNKYNNLKFPTSTKINEVIVNKILKYRLREDEAMLQNLIFN